MRNGGNTGRGEINRKARKTEGETKRTTESEKENEKEVC